MTNTIKNATGAFATKSIYHLRGKTLNLLRNAGLADNALDDGIHAFLPKNTSDAVKILWSMSFESSMVWALSQLGISTEKNSNWHAKIQISSSLVKCFRNELRYQYKQDHPDFLQVPNEFSEPFDEFIKKMGMDTILSFGIFQKLYDFINRNHVTNTYLVDKTIHLLESKWENYRYGGLKNIGLTDGEANELLNKAKDIANLADEILKRIDNNVPQSEVVVESEVPTLTEVAESSETPIETSDEEDSIVTISDEVSPEVSSGLSSQDVLKNPDLFENFSQAISDLTSAGFNPEEVLEKIAAIRQLLAGVKALAKD